MRPKLSRINHCVRTTASISRASPADDADVLSPTISWHEHSSHSSSSSAKRSSFSSSKIKPSGTGCPDHLSDGIAAKQSKRIEDEIENEDEDDCPGERNGIESEAGEKHVHATAGLRPRLMQWR